jgi:L-arabinokinase
MFRVIHPLAGRLPQDVQAVVDAVREGAAAAPTVGAAPSGTTGADSVRAAAAGLFAAAAPVFVARAPGRMDVMGGIADYSGSLVLQMPIAEAAVAAVQRRPGSRSLCLVSVGGDGSRSSAVELSLDDLLDAEGRPVADDAARAALAADASHAWAAYLAGAFVVLMRERGAFFDEGCVILLDSKVPEGKGVSSSAAIEVATMAAIAAAWELDIEPRDLALLCQKVENLVVGAPCGVMDQMTAACGEENRLLALLCQPAELLGQVALPADLRVWGLDSGIRHAVSGADYGSVRTGAFMGRRILERMASRAGLDAARWRGCLANVTPHEFAELECYLPERLGGADFLRAWGGTDDAVTTVDPGQQYAICAPTAHPVHEHHRIRLFGELLGATATPRRNELLGACMYQTHASYSACGLGSAGTDALARAVERAGPQLYGAKITGGGSGGTVAVLGAAGAEDAVHRIAHDYADTHSHDPYVFTGSSPGAAAFGVARLEPEI